MGVGFRGGGELGAWVAVRIEWVAHPGSVGAFGWGGVRGAFRPVPRFQAGRLGNIWRPRGRLESRFDVLPFRCGYGRRARFVAPFGSTPPLHFHSDVLAYVVGDRRGPSPDGSCPFRDRK